MDNKQFPWFKMHSKGWLTGTIRANLGIEERSVWADLLAMANESRVRGVICRAKGIPYDREYIASYLGIPLELLDRTIAKCQDDQNMRDELHRIELDKDGCLVVTNWDHYQAVPDTKQRRTEDAQERELRERRNLRIFAGRYPDEARKIAQEQQRHEELQRQAKGGK